MNIRKLSIFYETAKCLNMSQVAKDMFISQPSISQSISEIESELNVKLFDRIGKKLYLTHEGEIFFYYTQRILNLYEEGISTIKDSYNKNKGKIVVGVTTTIGVYIMPYIIKKFNKEAVDIDISIIIDSKSNIENLILHNKVDLAFIEGRTIPQEIILKEIWKDEMVFVSAKDHEWKNKKEITVQDLRDDKFIVREDGSGSSEIFEKFLDSKGIKFNEYIELGDIGAIINYVKLNIGVSCIPYISVSRKEKLGELNVSRFKGERIERILYMAIHKDKYISMPMKYFIDFCEKFDVND